MRTKLRGKLRYLGILLLAACMGVLSGCGGSNGANVITVSVTPSGSTNVIVGTSLMLTALVSGGTNLNVTWACSFTTTTTTGTKPPVTNPAQDCTKALPSGAVGNISDQQNTTVLFNAPTAVPDPTKFQSLVITITATSVQDTKRTGVITLTLDSGISVVLNPVTATVPTKEQEQFQVSLTNDTQNKGVTWLITQTLPTSTTPATPVPMLPTCSPDCGMIDPKSGLYTAPATVPTSTKVTTTPANVTVVVTANGDTTRFATGTITIINGGAITFNGISPTIAPQGALFWDIYLDAPLISSVSTVNLTSPGGQPIPVNSDQVKVLFPIPTTATPNPASTGARLRLLAPNLANAGSFTVSVTDRAEPVTQSPTGVFTFTVLPTRTTSISSVPDDVIQGTLGPQTVVSIDGGYFGPGGARANVLFGGNLIPTDVNNSNARQLNAAFPNSGLNSGSPGLYQLSVTSTTSPAPVPDNPSVTNLAVFPDYSATQPKLATNPNPPVIVKPIPAGVNPSAIDIDTDLGVVVVAEAGSNAIQFFRIVPSTVSATGTLVPIDTSGNDCATSCPVTGVGSIPMNLPVGVSVNRTNHTVAVVNYGQQTTAGVVSGQTVMDFSIPVPGGPQNPVPGTPFAVDISNALLGAVVPAPMAYAIGVDPDTNHALVAYSSIPSSTSAANLGFIVNLNPPQDPSNPSKDCPLALPTPPFTMGCLFAQVTLNTGLYPQIALAPHGSIAFVTPGGSGAVSGIDVTKASTSKVLSSIMLGAGVVTVATTEPHGLVPGNAGSVLITGVPTMNGAGNTNFNGVFSVTVDSSTTFSYALPNSTASGTVDLSQIQPPMPIPTVFFSSPNLQFGVSQTVQGIAINPITRTAALADANATGTNGPEIDLLSSLDQSVSSITFFANCTKFTTNPVCPNAPEFPGTTNLSWQPYTNSIVSYNPSPVHNLSQVSISDPVSRQRYAIVPTPPTSPQTPQTYLGPGGIAIQVQNGAMQTTPPSTQNMLTLWGGIAVDPATNLAFVAESGSAATQTTPANPGAIEVIDLGPPTTHIAVKPLEITEVLVPSPTPGVGNIGGIPNTVVAEATLTSANDLTGVQIFGSGFGAAGNNTTQVRLDQTPIPAANVQVINDRKLIATIPHSFLSAPHHFALDIVNGGVQSNASDFLVVKAVDLTGVCAGGAPHPTAVAIADQIATGPFSPIAVITNSGCNNIAVIDINPADVTFGSIINTAAVGSSPQGIAVSQRFGLAVVANNGDGTASVIDLTQHPPVQAVPAVQTGANAQPTGVAINEATGAALVANFNANTVSEIDLALLNPPVTTPPTAKPTTLTATSIGGIQQPLAVAIDPDRGTNNQGLAVVTSLQLVGGAPPNGELSSVDIGLTSPSLSTTAVVGSVSATPTGIVFDPTAISGSANGGLFYAVSSGGNTISTFNPDTGSAVPVSVGINPTSIAYNPQTGALLTANFGGKSISIVDMLSNPFKTRQTLGLPGSLQFGVAIDQFTNLAVIVDQANGRVLLFPMPN